ncbi:MAG: polysaccharide biosynthesis/export family protein [Planctomycetota bacterium]
MTSITIRAILGVWLALSLGACSSAPPFDAKAVATEWVAYMQRDYVLRAGDRISVRVKELAGSDATEAAGVQEVVVSPTGSIDLRLVPTPLQVAGKSVGAARTLIMDAYKGEWASPTVSVALIEAAVQSVYVCGEVRAAGAVPYRPGLTMTQAIAVAGSFNYTVKHSDIRILRIAADGSQRTFRVNMDAVLLDQSPDFLLLPGDVVYCQTSGIADAGNWVDLWFRRLLPFSLGGPALGNIK